MALLNFSCFALFLIVMLLYSIVCEYLQYNAMHKFVGVLDFSPLQKGNLFCQKWYVKG